MEPADIYLANVLDPGEATAPLPSGNFRPVGEMFGYRWGKKVACAKEEFWAAFRGGGVVGW